MRHRTPAASTLLLLLAIALVGIATPRRGAAQDPTPAQPLRLFLLAGQSNMAGRGTVEPEDRVADPRLWMLTREATWVPAVDPLHFDKPRIAGVGPGRAFGLALLAADGARPIGLVPAAVGGTSIRTWAPGAFDSATGTHPLDDAVARIAKAAPAGRWEAILWLQGESDGNERNAPDYEARLRQVITGLRAATGQPTLPFLIGQMGRFPERPWSRWRSAVDSAHRRIAATVPGVVFVTTEGLSHKGDSVHYDAASARELGRRYATTFRKLTAR